MFDILDYVGRTVDLLAFQDEKVNGEALLTQLLVKDGERGEITAGVQKLAQRWLIEFLTIEGSIRAAPERGTQFINDIRTGQIRTTLDAEQSFYLAANAAAINLKLEEEDNIPVDEAYDYFNLVSIQAQGDTITAYVEVASEAGNTAQLILPIPIKVQ